MKGCLLYVVNATYYFLSHRLALAQAAREAGWDVHIATPRSERDGELRDLGFPVHPIYLTRWGLNPLSEVRSLYGLARLYNALRPDVVHHIAAKPIVYGGIAARMFRVRGVVHAVPGLGQVFADHGVRASALQSVTWILYRISMTHDNLRVIFQNPDDQDVFIRAGIVAQNQARLIAGAGVDTAQFTCSEFPRGTPTVVLASRLLRHKGLQEFVEAARIIRSAGISSRFVLIGEPEPGNPASIPQAVLDDWVKEGIIEWWGFQRDMPGVFAKAHVVCLPSYYKEGVPKVLVEAAACGRPLVASDVAGCREIVREGLNGFLVPPKDAVALASALAEMLQDKVLRERMGRASREIAARDFALSKVLPETLAIYDELVSQCRDGLSPVSCWSGSEES